MQKWEEQGLPFKNETSRPDCGGGAGGCCHSPLQALSWPCYPCRKQMSLFPLGISLHGYWAFTFALSYEVLEIHCVSHICDTSEFGGATFQGFGSILAVAAVWIAVLRIMTSTGVLCWPLQRLTYSRLPTCSTLILALVSCPLVTPMTFCPVPHLTCVCLLLSVSCLISFFCAFTVSRPIKSQTRVYANLSLMSHHLLKACDKARNMAQ